MEFHMGAIVASKNGRDAGRELVVFGLEENFLYLADGRYRRVEKPKKKKIKHVRYIREPAQNLLDKFAADIRVTNSDIRKELSQPDDALEL